MRLPASRERRLIALAKEGDGEAREQLLQAFLPAIGGMARSYERTAADRRELLQEGVVGMLRALERFDPEMGTPFWAYAAWWVRQAMQRMVAELSGPTVLSDRALRQLARLKEARRDYLQAHRREPSTSELVAATGLTPPQVGSLLQAERKPIGWDEPGPNGIDGSSGTLGESVADPVAEDAYDRVIGRIGIHRARELPRMLDPRERRIVNARFGLGGPQQTLAQIAAELELSVERVRQLEQRALSRLRQAVLSGA